MVKSSTQMDAGTQPSQQTGASQQSVQAGQSQPAQRRRADSAQAGGSSEQGRQMNGTQFTDWASI